MTGPAPEAAPAPSGEKPAEKPKGPPPEQVQRTLAWITDRFRAFYRARPPEMPPRFGRREFGFMWVGKQFFLRHRGFRSRDELASFLTGFGEWGTPHHCYYSTAYYKDPNQSTMKEKGWLGADLIFDLDADHLPNADKMTFTEQLVEVQKQARHLLEEFVLGDLGFDADHVRVVFSGGRGFHIHVDDPRVLAMDSASRREVIDYVVQRGVETGKFFVERTVATRKGFQGRTDKETILLVPPANAPGWAGHYTRGLVKNIREIAALPDKRAVLRWCREHEIGGIGDVTAEELLKLAQKRDASGLSQIDLIEQGKIAHPLIRRVYENQRLGTKGLNEDKGESDEPVTADIKRLIRLPGSLHGKTALRVTPIAVDGLKDFDPLREATVFGEEPVACVVSKPESIRLGGVDYACAPGPQELPERYALFLMLRRKALVP